MFLSNFNYSVLGNAESPRVVFIHGLMAFSANWRKIASRIQNDFQCLIYDQRGHGRSFKPESGYSPEVFAEDLNKITDELGWDSFHLVGHSMGGRNAIVFADLFPQKVRTLTIEDMGPEADSRSHLYYEKMLNAVPTPFDSKQSMKQFFASDFEKNFEAKEPISVLSTFLQANIEQVENTQLFDWRFSKQAIFETVKQGHIKDRWREVTHLSMPVLLIRGENSHVLKRETFEKMLQVNPKITGVEIKQAGHWIHYEKYEEFTSILREFLGKN
ncbi:MAG: alpha/beta hydrolase [Moraxellaceae bacterium]|nr:alpha/beta hydrolase [Pseudobdellovibrionaceae bacterium]